MLATLKAPILPQQHRIGKFFFFWLLVNKCEGPQLCHGKWPSYPVFLGIVPKMDDANKCKANSLPKINIAVEYKYVAHVKESKTNNELNINRKLPEILWILRNRDAYGLALAMKMYYVSRSRDTGFLSRQNC